MMKTIIIINIIIIRHKIPPQQTRNARNQGTTENSHIGHCTRTLESTNVKVQYSIVQGQGLF